MLAFTALDDKTVRVRHYEAGKISEAGVALGDVDLVEIGPSFDLIMRRQQVASGDLYKLACRKPKIANVEKKKSRKNTYTNELGERKGRVFVQHQDLDTIATRKFKKQFQPKKKIEAEDV